MTAATTTRAVAHETPVAVDSQSQTDAIDHARSADTAAKPVRWHVLSMHDYTLEARIYWWTAVVLGVAVLAFSFANVLAMDREALCQVAGLVAIAAVTGFFPVRLPGRKTSVAGAEIFVFLLLLLHGPGAATLAAACEGAVGSWRTSTRLTSRLGTPAMAALAMYGCGSAFTLALHFIGDSGAGVVFGLLLTLAVLYFASNTLLMASLISLKQSKPVQPIAMLREHAWLLLAFVASASISGLVYFTYRVFGTTVLVVVAPIIAMFLSTMNLLLRQAETEERIRKEKVAAAEKEVADTARHLAALQASEQRFHSAFTHAAVGMMLVSKELRILQTNEALRHQLARSEGELVSRDLAEIIDGGDIDALRTDIERLLAGDATRISAEVRCPRGDGGAVWAALDAARFSAEGSEDHCLIVQVQDVTARKRVEDRLHHIAYHDGLTQLPNRSYFLRELSRAVTAAAIDSRARFAVMFLDFDRFKLINDSMGHGAGDKLLITAAMRLKACLRPTDLVARLGGDEFAILVENFNHDMEIVELAERVLRVVSEPMRISGSDVSTSASIGITTSEVGYAAPEQVMRDADIAMYRAKSEGKARYAFFDHALHSEVSSQLWMEKQLRQAILADAIRTDFQPIVDVRTRQLYGFEALARWTDSERGVITPSQFIPLAEETGLILPLGKRVLETACAQLSRWRRTQRCSGALRIHVNVSGVQLSQNGFASQVLDVIENAAVPSGALTLELTENILVDRLNAMLPNLRKLRENGVRISIDDFGIGYSSLSALDELPIDEFKIDRSFVQRLAAGRSEAVVNAILVLGRSLGKDVIIEGIETTAQLDRLIKLGCDRGQGFLLGAPVSAEIAGNLVREIALPPRLADPLHVAA
jgi:diguanylate cyclase (GGDEF)-like protein/PAS domain S-box-containing protein